MKAAVYTSYGPPEVLQLHEVEKPQPKDNEILIKNAAATVTSAECIYRKGDHWIARFFSGIFKPKQTRLGTYFAGTIESTGKNVRGFKVGDQVFGSASGTHTGTYAEYICLPENAKMAIKPSNLDFAEAAAICDGGLTALPFLRDTGDIRSGQKVLINGASGSIGTIAVQLGIHYGAEVTGVCSSRNLELVSALGAHHLVDYTKEDFTRAGKTYDIIFDTVGKSSFSKCKRVLNRGGVYLSTVPTLPLMLQMLWTSKLSQRKAKFSAKGMRAFEDQINDLNILKSLAEAHEIKPTIDFTYPIEQIAKAHAYVEMGHKRGVVAISV